tara:strand:+ start:389 stop:1138 length:750 start_codon:yes stop_codon:yes gene_type:complete
MFCDNDIEFEQTNFEYAYNSMNNLIVATLIYGLGLTVGTWFVAKFLWDSESVLDSIEQEEEEEVYENKYDLKNMQDLSGNKPTNTTIIENTPDGSVIMSYNYDKEGFEYWCDTKNIKYDYLETVARKFVKMNFCVELYIDRKENIKKQNELLDKIEKEEKEKAEKKEENTLIDKEYKKLEEEDSVFVKSKISVKAKQKKEIVDRTKIAATKANKYIRVGKCNEFQWLKKMKTKSKKKKISFDDFKNNFC